MRYLFPLIVLCTAIIGCASPKANLSPSQTDNQITAWQIDVEPSKRITTCGASSLFFFQLAIEPNGEWRGVIKLRNTDSRFHRDRWNNKITVAFTDGDRTLAELPLFDETMPSKSVQTYERNAHWSEGAALYQQLRGAEATLLHECHGINDS